jgi:quinol monooxygenase YgiN
LNAPVKTIAVFTAKSGCEGELQTLLQGMVKPSRAEPGNLRYDLWRESEQPRRFALDETYRDAESITYHRASEHFQAYLARIDELAVRTVVVLVPEDIA